MEVVCDLISLRFACMNNYASFHQTTTTLPSEEITISPVSWEERKTRRTEATRGGGEWEPIKISSKFEPSDYIPKNHPSLQAFWPKFGVAMEKLNQHKRSRTSERKHEANRKRIEKTAELICQDRSDRCAGPV